MTPDWQLLFGRVSHVVFLIQRGGAPFLYLPREPKAALATLSLYPPQKWKARMAKRLLKECFRCNLPLPIEKVAMGDDPTLPFPAFLAGLAGLAGTGRTPVWGMMAGNPRVPGQRMIFLVFNEALDPVAVVKLGVTPEAVKLIEREREILEALPTGAGFCIPVLGQWQEGRTGGAAAIAYPYVAGVSPAAEDREPLVRLLNRWLEKGEGGTPLEEVPEWKRLLQTPRAARWWQGVERKTQGVKTPLSHGDLVPWNIKVDPEGKWHILDWERGQRRGVPAWDWFHFELQPALLVAGASAETLHRRAGVLLESAAFRDYAARAGIEGLERILLAGYLMYHLDVMKQADGREALEGALNRTLR